MEELKFNKKIVLEDGEEYNSKPSNFRYTKTLSEYLEENDITMFTSLDTVKALLDVIEDMTFKVSTIDAE